MSSPARISPSRRGPSLRDLGGWVVAIPVAAVAALVLGALVPGIPRVSRLGAESADYLAWFVLAALVCGVLAVVVWWRRRTAARAVVAVIAVAAVVGALVVAGRQVAVARGAGVGLDVPALFALSAGDTTPDASVTYTRYEGEPVDLSVWRPRGVRSAAGAPVVVMVHGGGWIGQSRLQPTTAGHARWFADEGFLVVSADYSLSGPGRHLWDVQYAQIGCALAWTAAHAAEYGGDASRLALTGDSSGGNLALLAAYRGNAGTLTPTCGGAVPHVDAVSVLYPSASPQDFYENAAPELREGAREMAGGYTGGSPQEYPERYAAVTPANHLSPASPPTMVVLGDGDPFVPPQGAYDLVDRARRAGIATELIRIPSKEHIIDANPGSVWTQIWRSATRRWFADHGVAP